MALALSGVAGLIPLYTVLLKPRPTKVFPQIPTYLASLSYKVPLHQVPRAQGLKALDEKPGGFEA